MTSTILAQANYLNNRITQVDKLLKNLELSFENTSNFNPITVYCGLSNTVEFDINNENALTKQSDRKAYDSIVSALRLYKSELIDIFKKLG